MANELEYKYEVGVERREKPAKFDSATKEALREAGMMNNNKLKINGVSPKMLKVMKQEYVECPVLKDQIHFVQCFVCPNFQSRLKKMVMCRGEPLNSGHSADGAAPVKKKADRPKQSKPKIDDATPDGAKQGGAKQGGAKQGGAKQGGAKQGGAKQGGAKQGGAKPDGPKPRGAKQSGAKPTGRPRQAEKGRIEDVGITEPKSGDFSEWYTQVVLKAQLADYAPVKGMIALMPAGYSIWESIKAAMDGEFARVGVRNAFLPVLIPESLLTKEKTHFEGFNPEVFWVTHSGDSPVGERLALRPTSETIAYSLYSKWINSWRDLPLKLNFWNTALRAEIKSTKPFLRTSEFLWQEGHTVHATRQEAAEQVDTMLGIYRDIIENNLAIPVRTGRKSAREQFVGADYTLTVESVMPDGKALQMGTSHLLGQNFSKPFSVKYADRDNTEKYAWQTSWGVSWRVIGALIMIHGDDNGLVLPPMVAPTQVVIIPVKSVHGDEVWTAAADLADRIRRSGCRVHVDDRDNVTTGYKYGDWELRGVPLRVEMGPRDLEDGSAVLVRRDTGAKKSTYILHMEDTIISMLDTIQHDMLESARRRSDQLTSNADDMQSLVRQIAAGGFVQACWCGDQKCETSVKDDTGADIRLVEPYEGMCAVCGRPADSRAIFAKGY